MKKFIRVYVWFYLVLGLLGMPAFLGKEHSAFEILRNTLFWSFGPICIFLYIYGKKWLPSIFWRIYFILKAADVAYDFFYVRKFFNNVPEAVYIFSYLIEVILVFPVLMVIYRYAFKPIEPAEKTPGPRIVEQNSNCSSDSKMKRFLIGFGWFTGFRLHYIVLRVLL